MGLLSTFRFEAAFSIIRIIHVSKYHTQTNIFPIPFEPNKSRPLYANIKARRQNRELARSSNRKRVRNNRVSGDDHHRRGFVCVARPGRMQIPDSSNFPGVAPDLILDRFCIGNQANCGGGAADACIVISKRRKNSVGL